MNYKIEKILRINIQCFLMITKIVNIVIINLVKIVMKVAVNQIINEKMKD